MIMIYILQSFSFYFLFKFKFSLLMCLESIFCYIFLVYIFCLNEKNFFFFFFFIMMIVLDSVMGLTILIFSVRSSSFFSLNFYNI